MRHVRSLIALCLACLFPALAGAQSPEEFYRGRQVTIIVGSDAGGGYDQYARLFGRFVNKHIPGAPSIVVQNKAAAGGLVMMNDVATTQAKDGTVIGATQSGIVFERMLHLLSPDGSVAQFDSTRLNWLGTITQDVFILLTRHDDPVKTMDDLRGREIAYGTGFPNTDGAIILKLVNTMLGGKMKLITGYSGGANQLLALDRAEVDIIANAYSTGTTLRPNLRTQYSVLVQMGGLPHPDLKDVPFFTDLVKNEDQRGILSLLFDKYIMGRPFFVADGVPADRVKVLRAAFDQTMKDPEFLEQAKTQRLEINPLDGDAVQKLVVRLYNSPEATVRRTRQILETEK